MNADPRPLLRLRSEGSTSSAVASRRSLAVAVGPVLALLLAACSGATGPSAGATSPAPSPSSSAGGTASASATQAPSPSPAFPTSITDDEGTSVAIASEPQRIVSLTPAVTETLFAIGAGPRVVAKVEDVADYPPAAHDLPVVAKFDSVDVEKIVSLRADLVIAGGNGFNPPESINKLRSLGIPVVVVYAPDIDTVFKDIELVGTAVGEAGAAGDLAASMRAGFDQVGVATASLDKPRTFYEIDATSSIYGPAKNSFLEAMIRLAGGDPITTGSTTSYQISLETLVKADPQVIVLGDSAYGVSADVVSKRPGWTGMTAVKTGTIRPIDDLIVTRPGPRLVDGLRALALAIHPDVVLSSASPSVLQSASPSP